MTSHEFNQRYRLGKLNPDDFKKVSELKSNIVEIVGKPRKNVNEIFKRFFANPFYLFVFVVLVLIVITAIVAPLASPYGAATRIDNNELLDFYVVNLPSSYTPTHSAVILSNTQYTNISALVTRYAAYGYDLKLTVLSENNILNTKTVTWDSYVTLQVALMDVVYTNAITAGSTAEVALQAALDASSASYRFSILGTTGAGFDIWTRAWYSTAASLGIAVLVATTTMIIGTAVGVYLGFHIGTWIDTLFLRIIEIFNMLPSLVFFLIVISIFNSTNFLALYLALILVGWSSPVGTARLYTVIMKDREFVVAAQAIGATKMRRIIFHIFPSIMGKLANSYVLTIPSIIFTISSLAFLGFMADASDPNLGNVLNQAASNFEANGWNLYFPALILLVMTLSLQFVAIGFHDALDPRLRKAK